MAELLSKHGLYFDELNKIRVLDPQVANKTSKLKEECKLFVESGQSIKMDEFQKIIDSFISMIAKLAVEVENQKIRCVGNRNLVQSMTKNKEAMQQQHQALIMEKALELERLKITLNSLQKTEIEQQEIIDNLQNY